MSETRSGNRSSLGGLVGSLLMVLLLICFVWGLSRFQHRDTPTPATTVDYSAALATARAGAPFAVLAPAPAPSGWRATSVKWTGAGPDVSWHLGFLTSDGAYVGLDQGNALPRDFVAAHTPADQPGPPVRVNGLRWDTLSSSDGGEHALVREGAGVTTVVTGTVSEDELVGYVETLTAR